MKAKEGEKHFTASCWITSTGKPKKILLIHHKKLGRWLQPGGHIEKFENPVVAAIREVREETGLDISFLADGISVIDSEGTFLTEPDFLMEQTIPAHGKQPLHYHLDINYVVSVPEQKIKRAVKESRDIGWFTKKNALKLNVHEDTKVIIKKLM
ncbi:hypothetical protein A3F00_01650 [Candidatus Daviesbacteria bacterium RIFCSPHIGHO2_12_FULL_37_11]|uniref:Nudix hydrolase domain-containing protein n=1 Tax=Candidatus Daviesbacteria bacterium RIFCSPHIGHO2_12_FULL_37_11 TaxID=1797777 RepID=A0A1F5KCA7_9BACT|nr:MAG: hypothetical protein A2111_01505 [Candidatus Daviesbacteria bacterium GWA1_38_6]OGE16482.1 MAG: hypothetical protein A2769_02295 [Candidatus Daviesbacteria bacterium RIFCSPHIGHO2_01_FULL_37_27]OGE38577.1 MAG: hypothetical protein A3F00_01650 [Candidatus Daviesbacteria bacterium RIFCSPHIGHO2_12_FULL_37_11]OGE46288.1 MAG: hypothetical protein A3B39_03875 [Candidatus Daviesbacteria bacterium RIFCSPLOWO2_01_FULL_37_10]